MTRMSPEWRLGMLALALAAVGLPCLLGYSTAPSTTFLNQATALIGWGLLSAGLAWTLISQRARGWRITPAATCVVAALLILLGAALVSIRTAALPSPLGLSSAGMLAAALMVFLTANAARTLDDGNPAFEAFCTALVAVALVSTAIAIVQYFAPNWPDGNWIARPASPGRVGGNLRQANHLSTLLLWGMAATVWLYRVWEQRGTLPRAELRGATVAILLLLTFGAVLTVSRTGTVCILLLALWGALDKRLPPFIRVALWVLPLVYALFWFGLTEWAHATQHAFSGDDQLKKGDLSSSRFAIWANTLALIKANPWWGVGWGEFNFAWTLTPFPGRPVAFFDHTHNLPLQLAVEIGIPLTVLVHALLLGGLVVACRRMRSQDDSSRLTSACALVMVAMIGVHSQLEYPLWYAYFLLPAAFALGTLLGQPALPKAGAVDSGPWLVCGSVLLTAGGLLAIVDYLKVEDIFAPSSDSPALSQRIVAGQRSLLFAHHADYAAATTAESPSGAMPSFAVAPHYLLDARLMIAWAKALDESGDVERARYVSQRLKEFRHALGDAFFAPCGKAGESPLPFQCTPPSQSFTFRDFRRP